MKRRFGVELDPTTETLALIGSKEGIAHLFPAFVDPGDYTLVPGVGYPVYHTGGILVGGETHYMPMNEENGWLADFESTPGRRARQAREDDVPQLPEQPVLGRSRPSEYFDRAIAFAKEHDLLLVHDNAYSEIGFDGYRPPSLLERPGAKDVAIELFSCSKAYNMTGWRVAFAAATPTAIKALGTVKSNIDSGMFTAVQDAAIEAMLGPQDDDRRAVRHLPAPPRPRHGRARARSASRPRRRRRTIYVWAKVPEGYTSAELRRADRSTRPASSSPPGTAYGPTARGTSASRSTTPDDRLEEAIERIETSL